MKPREIAEALRQTNRWWRRPGDWQADDPDLRGAREAPFHYEPRALENLVPDGLYVLRGPRRVGKSVELKRAIGSLLDAGVAPRRIIHASVEGWRDADLGGLVRAGRELETRGIAEPRFWFIDEITGVAGDWPNRLKWLRDNTELRADCVVLTGSSAQRFDEAVKALAGRRGDAEIPDRVLLPMGFGSFCRALGIDLPWPDELDGRDLLTAKAEQAYEELRPHLLEIVDAWELYLTVGGFPRAVADYVREHRVGNSFIDSLWDVIYGDAIRYQRFSASQVQELLAGLVDRLCTPLNVSALAGDISAGRDSLSSRLKELYAGFIAWPCFASREGSPNLRAQNKVYFLDPLFARLAQSRRPAHAPTLTGLSQQQLGFALVRQATRRDPATYPSFDYVLYYRAKNGKEIDFVGGSHETVPLESKYVDGAWRRDAQTIRAAFGRGIVATRSLLELDEDVWAVPAPLLALILDP